MGEHESDEAGNRHSWGRGEDRKRRKNLKMHDDGEGSGCKKDYMVSPLFNKTILKHQIKKKFFFFFKNQTWFSKP